MATSMGLSQFGLWVMTALILIGAVWVVTLTNLFRAALSLGVVLLGVAGLFLFLHAEFLAFVQILVYVGAILTLVVFAVMLTARMADVSVARASRPAGPAAVVSIGLFLALVWLILRVPWPALTGGRDISLHELGRTLVTTLVLPFEVISVVLVAAMIGAIAVASVSSSQSAPRAESKRRATLIS